MEILLNYFSASLRFSAKNDITKNWQDYQKVWKFIQGRPSNIKIGTMM
jgi:head-tail adaptor